MHLSLGQGSLLTKHRIISYRSSFKASLILSESFSFNLNLFLFPFPYPLSKGIRGFEGKGYALNFTFKITELYKVVREGLSVPQSF